MATYYGHRFGQEHGYRVDKQALLWAAPHLRTPDQFQRWTDVVAIVRNELRLARPLVAAMRRPWESPHRPITPQQVRRAMARLIAQVGTPAPAPLPRGKAPGRAKGATIKPATRHPVIIKGTKPARSAKKTTKKAHVPRE